MSGAIRILRFPLDLKLAAKDLGQNLGHSKYGYDFRSANAVGIKTRTAAKRLFDDIDGIGDMKRFSHLQSVSLDLDRQITLKPLHEAGDGALKTAWTVGIVASQNHGGGYVALAKRVATSRSADSLAYP